MMRMQVIAMVSAATLALAGCGKTSDSNTTNATTVETSNTAVATTDGTAPEASGGQAFANAAAASDAFEIASSKLALSTSKSAPIKKFAQQMIDAHTASTAKLKTAAAGASPAITPDPTLTPDQQAKIDALQAAMGTDFDRAYAIAQAEGHQKTLDTLKAYAASGDVPALKAFATELTPTVAAHLNMATALKP